MKSSKWTIIYLWRGERHRGSSGTAASLVAELNEMRAKGWQAWLERN